MKKKIVIGIPAMDLHETTGESLSTTASYVTDKEVVTFVIVDNASEKPYKQPEGAAGLHIDLIRNETNLGYYYPLMQLYVTYPEADYIGLMHNDAIIYEQGWEQKILDEFEKDPKLACVGLFGWQQLSRSAKNELPIGKIYWPFEVDNDKAPAPAYSQPHRRVHTLTPALVLDSLFMVFRREVISSLGINRNITISHGYDKIWSLRLIEQGLHVAVLGIPFLHKGGNDKDIKMRTMFKEWFDKRWEVNSPVEYVYDIAFFETQVLVVDEFRERKKMIPARIDDQFNLQSI